jgi:hypothetical protein
MAGKFATTGNVIKGAAALIALFPGIAVIFDLVDIPPTVIQLVRIISFSVGIIVLLAVFLLRDRIVAMSNERAAILGVVAVLIGAASLTGYYQFASRHTVIIPVEGTDRVDRYVIPLNPTPEIRTPVEIFGGDYDEALRMSPEAETLKIRMRDQQGSSVVIMVLLLVLSQVFLVAPVVAAAWKLVGAPVMDGPD